MNRRNVIKLLACLSPLPFVARMFGEKELKINPAWENATHEAKVYLPSPQRTYSWLQDRFSFTVVRLEGRKEEDGEPLPPCFRAIIRDYSTDPPHIMALNSPDFTTEDSMRDALTSLYANLAYVVRRRQFPNDTYPTYLK